MNWRSKLLETVPPIVLGVMFWALVVLIVIVTAASTKGNPWVDVATVVGGFGQVFFAGLVWLLAKRQFEFSKQLSDTQGRTDLRDRRARFFGDYVAMVYKALSAEADHRDTLGMVEAQLRAKPIFSAAVMSAFEATMIAFANFLQAKTAVNEARKAGDPMTLVTKEAVLLKERNAFIEADSALKAQIVAEMNADT